MNDLTKDAGRRPNCDLLIYILGLSGGAGRNAVNYANTLADAGLRVALAYGSGKGWGLDASLDSRVTRCCLKSARNLRSIPALTALLRRTDPARALVIGPSNMVPFRISALLAGYSGPVDWRVSNSPTGLLAGYPGWKRAVKKPMFARALRRADRLIALNPALARELHETWQVPRDRITVIPNGVALPNMSERPAPRVPPVILCVARLQPQKDHATLLRAFALLRKRKACRLQLAGDGSLKTELERLTDKLEIRSEVDFLGHVHETTELYLQASITVLSSRFEGFPNVLIESLAHGTPVVATDCPSGPAEVIDSPSVGLLCEPGNADQLADRLEQALDTEYRPEDLRARAAVFSDVETARLIRTMYCS